MAWITARQLSDGSTSHTVQWRDARGRKPSETFALAPDASNDPADEARRFKLLVEAHGNDWPPGWVKGQGFVALRSGRTCHDACGARVQGYRLSATPSGTARGPGGTPSARRGGRAGSEGCGSPGGFPAGGRRPAANSTRMRCGVSPR